MHVCNWRYDVSGKVVEVLLGFEAIDEALLRGHVQHGEVCLRKKVAVVFEVEPHEAVAF
jgi:hypothetical protein